MTLYSQDSQNLVENLTVYKYTVKGKPYVMFEAEDYRTLLKIGREFEILQLVTDSIKVEYKKLEKEVTLYIMQVDDFQRVVDQMDTEIIDLKRNFKEYSEKTEKKLARQFKVSKFWRTSALVAVGIVVIETIVIIAIAR